MKTTELNYGITQRINNMIALGMSKEKMIDIEKKKYIEKHGSEEGWKDCFAKKNQYLRSIGSINTMRNEQVVFVKWAKSQEKPIKKFEHVTREHLCKFLLDRSIKGSNNENLAKRSAWTLSTDMHFVNKVFSHITNENPITKKELGLKSRRQKDVIRGRGNKGIPKNRPGLAIKYKDQITFTSACGARRESIIEVTYDRFTFNEKGMPILVYLKEKGGKSRDAYILPEYQNDIKAIIAPHKGSSEPIFEKYDKNIGYHVFRQEYAEKLLEQVMSEHERGEPYYQGDVVPKYKLTKKDAARKTWRGIDVKVCALVSHMLGHNRVDVLASYIK